MKLKTILPLEPMSYKQQSKDNDLLTKWRVLREVIVNDRSHTAVAQKFSMHRNTVRVLVNNFETLIPAESKDFLLRKATGWT